MQDQLGHFEKEGDSDNSEAKEEESELEVSFVK